MGITETDVRNAFRRVIDPELGINIIDLGLVYAVEIDDSCVCVMMIYGPRFYLHFVVLHASLILRVIGDLNDDLGRWRVWGGLLNAIALLLFVVNVARSIAVARRSMPPVHSKMFDRIPLAAMRGQP